MSRLNLMSDDEWDLADLLTHDVWRLIQDSPLTLTEMDVHNTIRTALRKFDRNELTPIVEQM